MAMEANTGETAENFGPSMRHRLVEDFAVAYYNGSLKPNLAEKSPMDGRDAEYLMDGRQFEKIRRSEIWSYSNATGTGYQFRVTYKDKRFSDLEPLLKAYSGGAQTDELEREAVEQKLYEVVMLLIKEGRLPKNFKIQPARDSQLESLTSALARTTRALNELEQRVRRLEEARAARVEAEQSPPPAPD